MFSLDFLKADNFESAVSHTIKKCDRGAGYNYCVVSSTEAVGFNTCTRTCCDAYLMFWL